MAQLPHRDHTLEREEKRVVVTHMRPDTDAWLCIWLVWKYMLLPGGELKIKFVRGGEQLPADEVVACVRAGYSVIHVDTGLGRFDQHGKQLGRTSSFELLATALGVEKQAEIVPLLELANATDSAEAVDQTSIHFLFKSLPVYYWDAANKETDWGSVLNVVTTVLESMTAQWAYHARQRAKFDKALLQKTASGRSFVFLEGRAALREAAFEAGADIVLFTEPVKGGSYVVAQVSRDARAQHVTLEPAIAALRRREAELRKIAVNGFDYAAIGKVDGVPGWYFHDSRKLIACGSRAHPLKPHEITKMKPQEIAAIFQEVM